MPVTRMKKLSAKEAVLLERHAAAIGHARDRLNAAQNAANASLRTICPEIVKHEGMVDTEEDGDDLWLVVRASEPAAGAPVDPGVGGDGKARVRAVAADPGGEPAIDRAVRSEKP